MEISRNEKGVTLVEVLVSMVILTIILLTVMRLFAQMGFFNSQNVDKNQAVNLSKEVLINWQESSDVKWFLLRSDQVTGFTSTDPKVAYSNFHYDSNYYYFDSTKSSYTVHIRIKKSPDTHSRLVSVNSMYIQLVNSKGNLVSESYGFVKR